jgi:hypothetical protein
MRLLAAAALASLATASSAAAAVPLRAPTGYRDYCDGLGTNRVCPRGGVPQALWRPLHLPPIAYGTCPVTTSRAAVYTTRTEPWEVQFPPPESSVAFGSGWAVDKTPLLLEPGFRGPFVIRGRRLDGPGELGFSGPAGRRPFEALQFARDRWSLSSGARHGWGVLVWMQTSGCYLLQIDGPTFSSISLFRVDFVAG